MGPGGGSTTPNAAASSCDTGTVSRISAALLASGDNGPSADRSLWTIYKAVVKEFAERKMTAENDRQTLMATEECRMRPVLEGLGTDNISNFDTWFGDRPEQDPTTVHAKTPLRDADQDPDNIRIQTAIAQACARLQELARQVHDQTKFTLSGATTHHIKDQTEILKKQTVQEEDKIREVMASQIARNDDVLTQKVRTWLNERTDLHALSDEAEAEVNARWDKTDIAAQLWIDQLKILLESNIELVSAPDRE